MSDLEGPTFEPDDLDRALEAVERAFGDGWTVRSGPRLPPPWVWRVVPFGPCVRCRWPANCLGPNSQPWHAYCWGDPAPPGWWSDFVLRKVRAGEWSS